MIISILKKLKKTVAFNEKYTLTFLIRVPKLFLWSTSMLRDINGYSFIASDVPVRPGLYGDIEELDNTLIFMPND